MLDKVALNPKVDPGVDVVAGHVVDEVLPIQVDVAEGAFGGRDVGQGLGQWLSFDVEAKLDLGIILHITSSYA